MAGQRIISADSHVSIPGELFEEFLPSRYRGDNTPNLIGSSLSSRQKQEMGAQLSGSSIARLAEAMRLATDEGRPLGRVGGFDASERLVDMDADGVYAEVLYGSLGGFYEHKDPEARRAHVRAYNDALWEWCSADHDRLIPVADIPIDPVELGVEELKRLADKGYRTGMIPVFPEELGLPRYWDRVYDPLLATASELEFPLSVHVGQNAWTAHLREVDPTPHPGHRLAPIRNIGVDHRLALLVEDIDATFENLARPNQSEGRLRQGLDRKSMTIPAEATLDVIASHIPVARDDVLDGSGQ